MKVVNFGIVGFGNIGRRHKEKIDNNKYAKLIAVCDINQEKFNIIEEGGVIKTTNYNDLLNNPDIDIISIATPNSSHCEFTIAALEKGKHVLCEKPMSLSVLDSNKMILSAEKNARKLFVVKQNRFNPPIKKIKELLEEGKLGEIDFVVVNCFWNRNKEYYLKSDWKGKKDLDGGTLYTQFSHFIDIIYFMLGDFISVHAMGKNLQHKDLIEFEDSGVVNFGLANGGIGAINYTTCAYNKNMEGSITLFGKKGTVKIGGQYLNTLEYQEIENVKIESLEEGNSSNDYGYYQGSMSNHDKSIENVIKTLNNQESIATSAFEGMKTIQIIEAIYESMETSNTVNIR